ncbi:MAG: DUF2066 domain-containing protein [Thermomonas sp.]|uniref:DUF2066 domain-containing protein n=1 Tax=Thermomonas sp. TaxID=1971895 RepID=UPI002633A30A|nr:DUF2066 domain-containing protein [Thermomonas sp.]MCC7095777.1 DUF2066 domain-containing protein [Thermomonas sp.]
MRARSRMKARGWAGLLLAMLGVLASGNALAQRTEGDRAVAQGTYEVEVPVRNQTDAERKRGMAAALAQVLVNVTGDRGAAARGGVREEMAKVDSYVESFDFRQDEGVGSSGAPSYQTKLVVRFKPDAVNDLVDMLGLPNWPLPRPKPVLWLAIDDGSGPRLVGLGQANAARSVLDQAKARGYSLGLPAGNAAEMAAVGAIWRGDSTAISTLSRRYSPPIQLVGKMRRLPGQWQVDWMLVDGGKVLNRWQPSSADARRAMAGGADGAADALYRRYARAGSGGGGGMYRIQIAGLRDGNDYLRVAGYLGGMSMVKRIVPVAATPDRLELQLELNTGMANFARYVGRGDVLVAVPSDPTDTGATDGPSRFRLSGD